MKLKAASIRNLRRLENVDISLEDDNTVFVGPNNSGKTTATSAFRLFLKKHDFTIHDFTVSRIADLNTYGFQEGAANNLLPAIEMDLWFEIDPTIEYGRVFSLLPNISSDFNEVGICLSFCVDDAEKLKSDYISAYPPEPDGNHRKSLYDFLSVPANLSKHFSIKFYFLEKGEGEVRRHALETEEGKRVVSSLIRVDFVDAQRNIHDQEEVRSNRLSTAFAAYYKRNLEKPEANEAANKVIDENNDKLTEHYGVAFQSLFETIAQLGVPSVHDRSLRLKSSLSAQEVLKGNTELLYVDSSLKHELPEAYNGLGFKNLVYMAIQVSHFQLQWINTESRRPLCQLICIEEPEVHLHAQAQQTFISNIWRILCDTSQKAGEAHMIPQLALTTHSSHIVDTLDFSKIRYFKRCPLSTDDPDTVLTYNASAVLNLRDYVPDAEIDPLPFLQKYMRLTHCDLFFADAAIMVEGAGEKLLLPQMIEKSATHLQSRYLTILEIGGAYAYRFAGLMSFIGIPYLVIADIDSVIKDGHHPACRADTAEAITSNQTLKSYLGVTTVSELVNLSTENQTVADGACFVAFQKPVMVALADKPHAIHARTFEEAFVYENLALVRSDKLGINLEENLEAEELKQSVYTQVLDAGFKKTDFALGVLATINPWNTPNYIAEGLKWLEALLFGDTEADVESEADKAEAAE